MDNFLSLIEEDKRIIEDRLDLVYKNQNEFEKMCAYSFSVFDYKPIRVITSEGTRSVIVPNPPYVQLPIIKSVIEDLQGIGTCESTSISATPVNWVMDRILGKL